MTKTLTPDAPLTQQERIISDHLYSMVSHMIEQHIPVNILYQNNNDWNFELPERLQKNMNFAIKIENDTLADSYVDDDGFFHLVAEFDGDMFEKKMVHADILAILDEELKPLLMKPFLEKHPPLQIAQGKHNANEPTQEGLDHSMKMFKKNNPEMFTEAN